ncbi:MAG: hypothetical protein K0R46_2580 [Herbinix sp.]|jgi:hypothetical protein|nr:hypothetical protein [Herbinix sp.]
MNEMVRLVETYITFLKYDYNTLYPILIVLAYNGAIDVKVGK